MKRVGPQFGSGPSADQLKIVRRRSHTRSDAGRATSTSSVPRRDGPVTCHACGKRVSRRGLSQIYCSRRCRQRAYWDRRVLAGISAIVTHDSGPSTIPRKSFSKIKGLPKAKSRSSDLFATPVNVLGGGQWRWPNATRLDAQTLERFYAPRLARLSPLPEERICIMIKLKPNDVGELEPPSRSPSTSSRTRPTTRWGCPTSKTRMWPSSLTRRRQNFDRFDVISPVQRGPVPPASSRSQLVRRQRRTSFSHHPEFRPIVPIVELEVGMGGNSLP